jgi:hypothetical protein
MLLRDFLVTRVFDAREPTYMPVDPLVQFAHVLNRDGKPERVQSQSRVLVPMCVWDQRHENDLIAALLVQASAVRPHRAQNYEALNPQLWAKLTHNLNCLVLNPRHKGKFNLPRSSTAFYSEAVPLNRIVCLGEPNRVGTYLIKDTLRGVFVAHGKGVQSVAIYQPD